MRFTTGLTLMLCGFTVLLFVPLALLAYVALVCGPVLVLSMLMALRDI